MEIQGVLAEFEAYLLQGSGRAQIAKIILFGSQAKQAATERSDIDLLIVTTNGKRTEQALLNRVYDFMLEHNLPLEAMTASINDLAALQDYFLYNIIHYGVEVYSMEKEALKQIMGQNLLSLSEEYVNSAKTVLALNMARIAVDVAYNAAELAAKALILRKQDDLPGSHGGVANVFGQLYVKTGELDKKLGRALNLARKFWDEARYKPDAVLLPENARFVVELAEKLIEIASK